MTRGEPAPRTERDAATVLPDSGEAHGLPPARLTLTFGFGTGLFLKEGKDRYGLAACYPGLPIPAAERRSTIPNSAMHSPLPGAPAVVFDDRFPRAAGQNVQIRFIFSV